MRERDERVSEREREGKVAELSRNLEAATAQVSHSDPQHSTERQAAGWIPLEGPVRVW
jgi:hypothetical protein